MGAATLLQLINRPTGIVDPSNSQYVAGSNASDIVALVMDTIVTEKNTLKSIPTKSPIETGAFINDHVWPQPEEASFHVIISQAWLGGILASNRGSVLQNSDNPVQDAYNYLYNNIWQARAVFDFVSSLKTYQNFVLSECEINRDVTTGMALSADITIQQMVIVQSQLVNAPKIPPAPSSSAPSTANPAQDNGTVSGVPTTPAQQTENTAFLSETQGISQLLFGTGPVIAQ